MKYLLDTHALIWCLEADNQLSVTAQGIISDDNTDIYVRDDAFLKIPLLARCQV